MTLTATFIQNEDRAPLYDHRKWYAIADENGEIGVYATTEGEISGEPMLLDSDGNCIAGLDKDGWIDGSALQSNAHEIARAIRKWDADHRAYRAQFLR